MIARKIEDFKYDRHVINTDKDYVKRYNANIYYDRLQKEKDKEEDDKANKKKETLAAVL